MISWDEVKINAFEHLRTVLSSSNVLWLHRGEDDFILYTQEVVGAVLATTRDGEERPMGYYS